MTEEGNSDRGGSLRRFGAIRLVETISGTRIARRANPVGDTRSSVTVLILKFLELLRVLEWSDHLRESGKYAPSAAVVGVPLSVMASYTNERQIPESISSAAMPKRAVSAGR